MPVKAIGKKVVEVKTGKVVAKAKSKKDAKISARIRNMAHYSKYK